MIRVQSTSTENTGFIAMLVEQTHENTQKLQNGSKAKIV